MNYNKMGIIFTLILGTLLHFTFDFFGESDFVAIFSAVNESTWEHLKLLFFPVFIFALAEYFIYGKNIPNFWTIKTVSVALGMLFITTVFYTYTGIIGNNYAFLNIFVFVLGVILTYWLSSKFLSLNFAENARLNTLSFVIAICILILFWIFTFYPPMINLFKDPVTGGFGI